MLFVGMWVVISYVAAQMGGWQRLAMRFRSTGPAPRSLKRFVSGRFGWVNYNSCLTVGVDEHGLYLVPLFPFRAFHPPVRIPWSEFRSRTRERVFFFFKVDLFDLGPDLPMIQIRSRATRSVDAFLPCSG
ncbi:hypothetical protein LY474_09105 [Myxococcus stipitatus]|uniref:hypothetical protein n=1 Tax=Myxococcus stipitatus TaxID=83455 RepID=UPI001F3E34B0|nr:hypothetical protein [Myxococcus stipitatus]MCE9667967.1 hypothetical protein [Myxococcus stipitatus]